MHDRIIQPQRGVTEGLKKLHTEDLHDLYSSSIVIKIIKSKMIGWVKNAWHTWAHRLPAGKPGERRLFERSRHR
jgi:hypothetical protein